MRLAQFAQVPRSESSIVSATPRLLRLGGCLLVILFACSGCGPSDYSIASPTGSKVTATGRLQISMEFGFGGMGASLGPAQTELLTSAGTVGVEVGSRTKFVGVEHTPAGVTWRVNGRYRVEGTVQEHVQSSPPNVLIVGRAPDAARSRYIEATKVTYLDDKD